MILSCPSCSSRFKVNADQIGLGGRKVKCAKCGHTWHATPDQDEEAPLEPAPADGAADGEDTGMLAGTAEDEAGTAGEEDLPDEPPPFESFEAMRAQMEGGRRRRRGRPDPEAPRRSRTRAVLPWLVLLLVVGGLVWSSWSYRYSIVNTVPSAARLYAAVGIPINTVAPGLSIEGVTPSRRLKNGTSVLMVSGRVVNKTDATQPVPAMRVTLKGANGTEIASWRVAAKSAAIPPGGSTAFSAEKANPPENAQGVTIRFIQPGS
jgi:predicted Zn finger-like uncharacterized protein